MFTQRTSTIPGIGLVFRFNQVSVKSVSKAITMLAMVLALTLSISAVTYAQGKGGGKGGKKDPAPYRAMRLALPGGDTGGTEIGGMEISDLNAAGQMHLIANSDLGGDVHWVVDTAGNVISSEVVPAGLNVWGVNQWGQQVGGTFGVDGYRAFLRQNGVTTLIDPVMGDECVARDINETGTMIVGHDMYRDPITGDVTSYGGVYWRLDANGNVVSAHTLSHFLPHDVSENETMCGRTGTTAAVEPALLFLDENENQTIVPFGFPAGSEYGKAYVVNNYDSVVAVYHFAEQKRAAVWTPANGITMIPPLKPGATVFSYGLNDNDFAVGMTAPVPQGSTHASKGFNGFLYAGGVATNIHDLFEEKIYVMQAHKINNQNYIIGRGFIYKNKAQGGTSNWSAILLIPNQQ